MKVPLFNRTPKTPRPEISAPVPGSGRILPSTGPARPKIPTNEYPQSRPVPNTLVMKDDSGKINLVKLPPGSHLASPMMETPKPHTDEVDIHTLGFPANNHTTQKLQSLKDDHRQSLTNLNDARLSLPYLTKTEKKTLTSEEIKGRKKEIKAETKDGKKTIHDLEKAERQARRNIDVFKGRFSRELSTESRFRMNARASTSRIEEPQVEPSNIPKRAPQVPPPFAKTAKSPNLDSIPEHVSSPFDNLPPGVRPAADVYYSTPSTRGHHEQKVGELQDNYRQAKNTYHGMKAESAVHGKAKVETARTEFESAEKALKTYRKENKGNLDIEQRGYSMPSLADLRQSLHPGQNSDRYPAFETIRQGGPSASSSQVNLAGNRPGEIPRMPESGFERPSAPTPDHPRNRNAGGEFLP